MYDVHASPRRARGSHATWGKTQVLWILRRRRPTIRVFIIGYFFRTWPCGFMLSLFEYTTIWTHKRRKFVIFGSDKLIRLGWLYLFTTLWTLRSGSKNNFQRACAGTFELSSSAILGTTHVITYNILCEHLSELEGECQMEWRIRDY